jgi:hypothetical protein
MRMTRCALFADKGYIDEDVEARAVGGAGTTL